MTSLKDGRFVCIHAERKHLFLVQTCPTPEDASATSLQLMYGGVVHAFAINATQTRIAMICPAGSAADSPSAALLPGTAASREVHADAPQSVLRLFAFADGEVGELLDELVMVAARSVVWIGERYLALELNHDTASISAGAPFALDAPSSKSKAAAPPTAPTVSPSSTLLIEMTKSPLKLKLLREDATSTAPTCGIGSAIMCDIHTTKQTLRCCDVQKSKTLSESALPNRKFRHGKTRVAVTTCSDGPFVFVGNDDWTVHGFYLSRSGSGGGGGSNHNSSCVVRCPKPMLSQFEALPNASAVTGESASKDKAANDTDPSASFEGQKENGKHDTKAPTTAARVAKSQPPLLPTPTLHACALSNTQLLLALNGSPSILHLTYDAKVRDGEWSVSAKMRLPRRLLGTVKVVALSKSACLVQQQRPSPHGDDGPKSKAKVEYLVLPLDLKPTKKIATTAAGAADEGASSSSPQLPADAEEAAGITHGEMATAVEKGEAPQAEGKKKRKKKNKKAAEAEADESTTAASNGSAVAAPHTATSAPSSTEPDASTSAPPSRISAGGPTQRAVDRLLIHAGIAGKAQLLHAFTRGKKEKPEEPNAKSKEATAAATAPVPCRSQPPTHVEKWVSTDVLTTTAGAVLGMAVGIYLMRKYMST